MKRVLRRQCFVSNPTDHYVMELDRCHVCTIVPRISGGWGVSCYNPTLKSFLSQPEEGYPTADAAIEAVAHVLGATVEGVTA
ncbi:MAG: hypothetical protein VW405_02620 [Rhodospirillaceae bacterium]